MLLSVDAGPWPFEVIPAVRYHRLQDRPPWEADLHLDLLRPHGPIGRRTPLVVYFHGGAWESGGRELGMYPWINPVLAANGIATASVTYRLTTTDPFPAQLEDAQAALHWLRDHADEFGFEPNRLGVWGDSAGGHLALLLATQPATPVRAVVARCAPTDFRDWHLDDEDQPGSVFHRLFGGPNSGDTALRAAASPATYLESRESGSATLPPMLLFHGDRDETVPYSQSLEFARNARTLGVDITLRTIRGGHHNLTSDEIAPWTNQPWEGLAFEARRFFIHHLTN